METTLIVFSLSVHQKRMQQIMTQCFLAVKSKLDCRLGFFDLIGCDFMVDEDFKVCEALLNILTVSRVSVWLFMD